MEDAARRRFIGVLAGAGVVAAIGGGVAFMTNSRDPAARDAAVKATPEANGHDTQPWRFDACRLSTPTIITSFLASAVEPKTSFSGSGFRAPRERDFRHGRRRHTARPRTSGSGAQPAQSPPGPALQGGANSPTSAAVM